MKENNICLSHILTKDTPSYGSKDSMCINPISSIKKGDSANTSSWTFSNNHIGTHIDAPHHFCEKGLKTFEIPIDKYIFNNVQLINIPVKKARLIGIKDLEESIPFNKEVELLLIRTGYENFRQSEIYWNDNPGIDPELADYFREKFPKLRCLGFDFISLTSWKYRPEGRISHKAFLCPDQGKPMLIIEDMSLKLVNNKLNWVIVAPLFVADGNGGPVTIFAGIN